MNRKKAITTTIDLNKKIFWSLLALLVVLFGLYGYFISKSIVNVLVREEVEQNIVATNSEISSLEFAFLEQKNTISLNFAYERGWKDINRKEFVARNSELGNRLTLNNKSR